MIYLKDSKGRYLLVNNRFGELFVVDPETVISVPEHVATAIFKAFILIAIGTYGYAWFLSFIWVDSLKNMFSSSEKG